MMLALFGLRLKAGDHFFTLHQAERQQNAGQQQREPDNHDGLAVGEALADVLEIHAGSGNGNEQ